MDIKLAKIYTMEGEVIINIDHIVKIFDDTKAKIFTLVLTDSSVYEFVYGDSYYNRAIRDKLLECLYNP